MKKTIQYALLAVCALGVVALSTKLTAADTAMPSCCSGMGMAMMSDTNTSANTNGVPDLLTTCPVSGEKLGEMGKPLVFTYKGQEVKLCCSGCKKDFDKDPAPYIKKIQDAASAQK